jgi:peptide deformylase
MILKIVKYPEPILSQPGEPVTEFNAELRKLVADMFETTYANQGVGLAAPQVGVSKRVTVIDVSMGKKPKDKLVLVNPEITFSEGKLYEEEGCLSFPDIREKVVRAAKVRIRAQDVHGKWFEMDGDDLLARCLSARDRPPRRRPVSVSHERAEAQPESAQDSQDAGRRRVVEL